MSNLRPLLFRYGFYYPVALLRGQFVPALLPILQRSQYNPPAAIEQRQMRCLRELLSLALDTVPRYGEAITRSQVERLRTVADLSSLPFVTKADVKQRWLDFRASRPRRMITAKTTAGSTGQPITILKSATAMAWELAAAWRGYSWAGIQIGDPQGRFWGVPADPRSRLRAYAIDLVCHRHRCSAFAFQPEDLARYERELLVFRPTYFYGYASMLEQFALHFVHSRREPSFELKAIVSTAEVLGEPRRRLLERVFQSTVFDEYGCGEVGTIAHECECHRLHINSENLIVEVVAGSRICSPGERGEIVVTELHNQKMPLIRYRTGDFGIVAEKLCECGRSLPVLEQVEGRSYDFLTTRDGRRFHAESLMYVFEDAQRAGLGVGQFQVTQESSTSLRIRIVAMNGYGEATERCLLTRVTGMLGRDVNVQFERVSSIPRERSGKMRVIVGVPANQTQTAGK